MMKPKYTKVIYADDDADDQMFFEMSLREVTKDAELKTYNNGVELMKALEEPGAEIPDIIFLDLNMPRKNGLQCLEEIRKHEDLRAVTVVMLTTSVNQMDIYRAYDKGACLFANKPAELSKWSKLIDKVFTTDPTQLESMIE
jgi:CheY-like chemotaxis protein